MPLPPRASSIEACTIMTLSIEPSRENSKGENSPRALGSPLRALDESTQRRVRALHLIDVRRNWIVVFWPTVWIVAGYLIVSAPQGLAGILIQATAVLAIGVALQAVAILMHEALHGNLFRNPAYDRLATFAFGVPALFSGEAYRVAHLNHHRCTGTEGDQDNIRNLCDSDRQYRTLFYLWFFAGTLFYMVIVPWKAMQIGSRRERRRVILEYLLLLLICGVIVGVSIARNHLAELVLCWLLPMQVAMVMSNVRGLSEHLCTSNGDAWTRTRTTLSNRLVSFAMLNLNFHLEHHLFPGVPWYNLRKLNRELQPAYKGKGVFIQNSYLAYVWQAFSGGPHQTIRDARRTG